MARTRATAPHDELNLERTRASSVWVAVGVGVVFLILLIVFIAQNNRQVPVHFFTISGRVSEAVALLVAAVLGAVVVLMAGAARIIQLRLTARRHNKRMRNGVDAAPQGATPAASSPGAAQRETQPVEPEDNA